MSTEFRHGLKTGVLLYVIGITITIIVHLIFGWEYVHAPPVSAFPLAFTLIIGVLRLVVTAFEAIVKKSSYAQGELTIHLFMAIIMLILVALVF